MRGKKGIPHPDPHDPPRPRGNKRRGHGTWANDRPPVAGVLGRQTGRVRLRTLRHTGPRALQPFVLQHTAPQTWVYTDEWLGYRTLAQAGRRHAQVCHTPGHRVWARDDDGDGIREVHNNTLEGLWTGLRNFLRPFRGVSKYFLGQYVAVFQSGYEVKTITDRFARQLLGRNATTRLAS